MFYEVERSVDLHTSEDGIETLMICDGDESATIALADLPEGVRETLREADAKLETALEDLHDQMRGVLEHHFEFIMDMLTGYRFDSTLGNSIDPPKNSCYKICSTNLPAPELKPTISKATIGGAASGLRYHLTSKGLAHPARPFVF